MAHLKTNYHTHNQLCNHAVGNCEAYVLKAIELKMEEIGLSDHGPILTSFMSKDDYMANLCYRYMSMDTYKNIYLKELDEVSSKYSNKIKIYKGLEVEYLKAQEDFYRELKKDLDYLLAGIHYFEDNGKIVNSYSEVTYKNVLAYANTAVNAIKSGLYVCLVHPDLFMFDYKNINGERKFDENAILATKMIIEAAIENDVYLEINCNGISNSRKYKSDAWLYPYYEFWNIAKEYKDLKIVIGVDAHNPNSLESEDIKDVLDFVKNNNIKVEQYLKIK